MDRWTDRFKYKVPCTRSDSVLSCQYIIGIGAGEGDSGVYSQQINILNLVPEICLVIISWQMNLSSNSQGTRDSLVSKWQETTEHSSARQNLVRAPFLIAKMPITVVNQFYLWDNEGDGKKREWSRFWTIDTQTKNVDMLGCSVKRGTNFDTW